MSDFNDRGAFHDSAFHDSAFHDSEMENLLGRAGGAFPDVNVAFVQVQGRVRQAKRRRALVVSSAACSLLLAVGLLTVSRSGSSGAVQPNGRSTELGPDGSRLQPDDTIGTTAQDTIGTTTEATVATTIEDSTTGTEPVDTTAVSVPNSSQAPGNNGSNNTHSSSPGTVPKTTHSSAPTTSTPPETDPPTTPTVAAAPVTQTFTGIGGSITVRLENGHLTLVSSQPTAGFTEDVQKNSGSHIEVRFESDHHRTEARVDLHHGAMVQDFGEDEN